MSLNFKNSYFLPIIYTSMNWCLKEVPSSFIQTLTHMCSLTLIFLSFKTIGNASFSNLHFLRYLLRNLPIDQLYDMYVTFQHTAVDTLIYWFQLPSHSAKQHHVILNIIMISYPSIFLWLSLFPKKYMYVLLWNRQVHR